MFTFYILILLLLNQLIILSQIITHKWFWNCSTSKICEKHELSKFDINNLQPDQFMNIDVCQLKCMDDFGLWPLPNIITSDLQTDYLFINYCNITLGQHLASHFHQGFSIFQKNVKAKMLKKNCKSIDFTNSNVLLYNIKIYVNVKDIEDKDLSLETDESYKLVIKKQIDQVLVNITSENYYGFRLGLETLQQLIVFNNIINQMVMAVNIEIEDGPEYPYRGLMLDSARNFLTIDTIMRTLDVMALNKMNTLHWHLTDTHSFPFYSKSVPDLALYGAYSPEQIYYEQDIKNIVNYARIRGIRIIPEFDAPAHVGEGWQKQSDLILCFNKEPWTDYCVEPPCGQLNPINDSLYKVLHEIYADMIKGFRVKELFHMGGDEVNNACWNSSKEIINWMKNRNWSTDKIGFLKLWNYFQNNAFSVLENITNGINVILWSSELTNLNNVEKYISNKTYIIQIWDRKNNANIREYLKKGYRIILSNYDKLYLDCGFGGWVNDGNNWCSPYIEWQKLYNHLTNVDKKEIFQNLNKTLLEKSILGSEAALWTEQVDDTSIDSRIWPRVSALAEALWTKQEINWRNVEERLNIQRIRMVRKGIQADALRPQWCYQNKKQCII